MQRFFRFQNFSRVDFFSIFSIGIVSFFVIAIGFSIVGAVVYAERVVKQSAQTSSFKREFIASEGQKPQFVLLSFDGSRSIPMWRKILDFADEMRSKSKPVNFTFFVSGVYLLDETKKDLYEDPWGEKGRSYIGFASSSDDLQDRISFINKAYDGGHEIASHANGHFKGNHWSLEQWLKEFNSFSQLLDFVLENNDQVSGLEKLKVRSTDIKGFRAPELAVNRDMYRALAASGFSYDASAIQSKNKWPIKDEFGIWRIPLSTIFLEPGNIPSLSMDYNTYLAQTKGKDLLVNGTEKWRESFDQLASAYKKYFEKSYYSNRSPVSIGHHFSEWNDGLYWEVMKNFAEDVCGLPEVYCVTFSELISYLEKNRADN